MSYYSGRGSIKEFKKNYPEYSNSVAGFAQLNSPDYIIIDIDNGDDECFCIEYDAKLHVAYFGRLFRCDLARNVMRLMDAHGLTIEQMISLTRMTPPVLRNFLDVENSYITNKPYPSLDCLQLDHVAKVFGLTADDLIYFNDLVIPPHH